MNKKKIINDPVYGFINIPSNNLFDLISHPYVQRLRRIKQLGQISLVYPGAEHTRFSHSMGALHLMQEAIEVLRQKDQAITNQEAEAAYTAILLHDIGHSPFSHCLEHFFFKESHEEISLCLMKNMNISQIAIDIFSNLYPKQFLHQLVSSQVDTDRLDYLTRDSFFTGVSEGVIGTERIIKMFGVDNDELVIEEKGIYSIEKFIISRRLMYWQVYMHKTAVSADSLLLSILNRVRFLHAKGFDTISNISPCLAYFITQQRELDDSTALDYFMLLDDSDIYSSIKTWSMHEDKILCFLSNSLIHRHLPKVRISNQRFSSEDIEKEVERLYNDDSKIRKNIPNITRQEISTYFIKTDQLINKAYNFKDEKINIIFKNKDKQEICDASDQLDRPFLSKEITKYFLVSF